VLRRRTRAVGAACRHFLSIYAYQPSAGGEQCEDNRVNIPYIAVPKYGLIIEYAGLEERDYKFGLYMKESAFRQLGIPFVIMRPEDLDDVKKSLNQKLNFYFDLTVSETKPF
jgi:hypothetical protein